MSDFTTWMKSFVSAVDMGSFSRAGKLLNTNQSTISKHIAALEGRLQTRLFNRSTRLLALTDEGALFYESALRALAALDEAAASVGSLGSVEGMLRISMPLTLAESHVIPLLAEFLELHPGVEIDLRLSDHALNLVADNLDFSIRVGQLSDSNLIARKIGTARRIMVASPAYLGRAGIPSRPQDLANHRCIIYSLLSSGPSWSFTDGTSVKVRGTFLADNPNALRIAALSGAGIAVNARWLFERDLETGTLVEILPDFEPVPMPIHIMLPSGRYIAARTRALIEFIASAFANEPSLN
ncbi:LysR family transcriptional regulator [Sphingorhabdus lacus]|uniref:LysR family transcriptional regulator n=1 Tax=Sphingorhabdus lacus TaxID=392610 RepID=UPI003592F23D